MNKLLIISISLLLSVVFVMQSYGQTLSEKHTELIKNQVDSMFQKMLVFAEKLDFRELSSGVDDSHRAGFISNGKYYPDYSSLIDDVEFNARGIRQQEIAIKEKKITVLSDKIALMTASGTAEASLEDGRLLAADFHWSFIYEKIEDKWKVIYSHQSITR
jgi:hypothetical protein